jgi:hypothetical protein
VGISDGLQKVSRTVFIDALGEIPGHVRLVASITMAEVEGIRG